MTKANGRDKVFISYSHHDTWWLEEFMRMMAPLARSGKILLWSDSDIAIGSRWREEIDRALCEARVAVLAISDHFMQSDFIHRVELPHLLLAAENDGVQICWCLLSACIYEDTPIGSLQAAHDISRSFDKMKPAQRKEALKSVACKVMSLYERVSPPLSNQAFNEARDPEAIQGSKTNTGVLTVTSKAFVELTINQNFEDFTPSDQEKLLQGIARILQVSDAEIRIRNKRRGSIILELELSTALAEKLVVAAREGRLEELGILRARKISQIGSSGIKSLFEDADPRIRKYTSRFSDLMEMRAPVEVVASYLARHKAWFIRCAKPMAAEEIGNNSYAITLGRFGNFGFEVEPTIGLELLSLAKGVYRIQTVPVPDADPSLAIPYHVEFNACLQLDEITRGEGATEISSEEDALMGHTLARWELDLMVMIYLPSMLTLLPEQLVQSSGDHLLRQIVRQISRRLTWKVQEDFHACFGIPCPPRRRASF